ncbi:MAG: protein SrpA [Cyanobium sp. CACIAM 14]|nr:MAG: protein SrpA [Cyanobium sp. CACIAM 14]
MRSSLRRPLALALVAVLLSLGLATASFARSGPTAEQLITAIENAFGITPGQRRNHIKGTCATGVFVANGNGARFSRSPLFSGRAVPVVARFSLAGGKPKAPDTTRNPRGLGLQFQLSGEQPLNMAMISTPVFGAATPRTFHDNMIALAPDPATGKPNPEAVKAFRASHPDNQAQSAFLATNNPPVSYATSSYYSLHAFRFINRANRSTLVRWQFVPHDGEQRLTAEALASGPANFLEQRLLERTKQGPVKWDLVLTLGRPGDVENDPSVAWPEDRTRVTVGTLTLTAATPQADGSCGAVVFDPLVLGDGIQPTDDPVLQARSEVYGLSYARRSAESSAVR